MCFILRGKASHIEDSTSLFSAIKASRGNGDITNVNGLNQPPNMRYCKL